MFIGRPGEQGNCSLESWVIVTTYTGLGLTITMMIVFFLIRYVHVLVQKLAVNADLGFILALVDFFSIDTDPLLEVIAI